MFHFFAQKRLQSRGFSSGRKRRRPNETAFSAVLRSSFQVCLLLFVVFAALVSGWIILSGNEEALFAGNPMQAVVVVTVITATVMIH